MKFSVVLLFFFFYVLPFAFGQLRVGFYNSACPKAESIIQQAVQKRFSRDKSITAALVRLTFHDCFVRGCDASLLIDSTNVRESEKGAFDSLFLRGFDVIDEIKINLEAACPSTVSCADIIQLAARDAAALAGGPKYQVPTGRRDGLFSHSDDVALPQPEDSLDSTLEAFTKKGLTLADMVILLGAHTVGVAHCGFFRDRLENGTQGPEMDPALKAKLRNICKSGADPTAFLDQNTSFAFDNEFYGQLLKNRALLALDQRLTLNNFTRAVVGQLALDGVEFQRRFAAAMIKMGSIEVLLGNEGEIRKNCRVFNNPN